MALPASSRGRNPFALYHPGVPAAYFASVVVLAMATMQPVFVLLGAAGALCACVLVRGWRASLRLMAGVAGLACLVAAANLVLSPSGST